MSHPSFKSPYAHITDKSDMHKVGAWVGKRDWLSITNLVPDYGWGNYLISTIVKNLAEDFRSAGFLVYDPTDPEYYTKLLAIANRRIGNIAANANGAESKVVADTTPQVVQPGPGQHESAGARTVHKAPPLGAKQPARVPAASGVGRGSGGGSKETGKGKVQRSKG